MSAGMNRCIPFQPPCRQRFWFLQSRITRKTEASIMPRPLTPWTWKLLSIAPPSILFAMLAVPHRSEYYQHDSSPTMSFLPSPFIRMTFTKRTPSFKARMSKLLSRRLRLIYGWSSGLVDLSFTWSSGDSGRRRSTMNVSQPPVVVVGICH